MLIGLAAALRPLSAPAEFKALIVMAGGIAGSFGLAWLLVRIPVLRASVVKHLTPSRRVPRERGHFGSTSTDTSLEHWQASGVLSTPWSSVSRTRKKRRHLVFFPGRRPTSWHEPF